MSELTDRGKMFRTAIAGFIEARREAKLKGKDEEGDSTAKYEYASWLADAASRAHNLKLVTHPIKFTHGSIKGASSIYLAAGHLCDQNVIGTHSITKDREDDFAISDAKHLDVYSFFKEVVLGKRLIHWILEDDVDLMHALDNDPHISKRIIEGFQRVNKSDETIISNSLAKQVYWLAGRDPSEDDQYNLLQPMFSSSLEHAVNSDIKLHRESFFSARGTKKQAGTFEDHQSYPALIARKIGGSNAQNVSPMNKVRGGINYLLPSLPPPGWDSEQSRPLLGLSSAMERLAWEPEVRKAADELAKFLLSEPPATIDTRRRRGELARELGAQLAIFAAQAQLAFPPGWTRQENCTLPLHQQVWLDPERVHLALREDPELAAEDQAFVDAWECGDWPDRVAGDFANWLNQRLRQAGLIGVGDAEYRHWARQAIVDAPWPVPLQRRAVQGGQA